MPNMSRVLKRTARVKHLIYFAPMLVSLEGKQSAFYKPGKKDFWLIGLMAY